MVILSSVQESGMTDMDSLKGMIAAQGMDDTKLTVMKDEAVEEMGDMSDSIITQKAILFIQKEYEAMGMDLNQVQMNYLLSTGAKMLGLTLLMMRPPYLQAFYPQGQLLKSVWICGERYLPRWYPFPITN